MLHHLVDLTVNYLVPLLELVGITVIAIGSFRAIILYVKTYFGGDISHCKLSLAESLALGLEFKMGAEILKTVQITTLEEIAVLGAIILLRVILTFVIHWEIKVEKSHCH